MSAGKLLQLRKLRNLRVAGAIGGALEQIFGAKQQVRNGGKLD
jgi:hypothetical protein